MIRRANVSKYLVLSCEIRVLWSLVEQRKSWLVCIVPTIHRHRQGAAGRPETGLVLLWSRVRVVIRHCIAGSPASASGRTLGNERHARSTSSSSQRWNYRRALLCGRVTIGYYCQDQSLLDSCTIQENSLTYSSEVIMTAVRLDQPSAAGSIGSISQVNTVSFEPDPTAHKRLAE